MSRIGIDFLSVLGMPLVDYVKLAAKLGCDHISIGTVPVVGLPEVYAPWTLRGNPQLMRDFKAALADHDVKARVGEGFFIQPGGDITLYGEDLDLLAQAGVQRVTICSFDGEKPRAFDELGRFTELAAASGIATQIEFVPSLGIGDLPTALEAVRHVGRSDFGVVIDAMHLFRSGGTAADVAALDPAVISHVQLCDVPADEHAMGYGYEASFERLCPGEGSLPLASLVAALPAGKVIGLEIPMRERTLAGESAEDRLAPSVAAARALVGETAAAV